MEFDDYYDKINWRMGPYATQEFRQKVLNFWMVSGPEGIAYLVDRLTQEPHLELLEGVPDILASIGEASVAPLVKALNYSPMLNECNVEACLKPFSWMGKVIEPDYELLEMIDGHLNLDDDDVFEAAVLACKILPVDTARLILAEHMPRIEKIEHFEDYLYEVYDRPPCSNS